METQTTKGKKLLNLIRAERSQINRANKRVRKIQEQIKLREAKVTKLIGKMSNADLALYCEQFERMSK